MFSWLLKIEQFMPHGMCLLWQPGLMTLHIVSDLLIAMAYFAIPVAIGGFLRLRPDLNVQHKALAALFAVFITACGLTHLMSILVLWQPYYDAEGVLKAVTALLSVATAMALPFLIPQLLRIPSPRVLAAEIEAHKSTLKELQAAREQLARRAVLAEDGLAVANRRFQTALDGSAITVFEQDENLRYTWVYNPTMGLDSADLIGKTEMDFFNPEAAESLQNLKRSAIDQSAPQRAEILIGRGGKSMWFDIRVIPVSLSGGKRGIVAAASEITSLKRQQEHLQVLMTELNHRSKNLLTIVLSIIRQTGRVYQVQADFMSRLNERLTCLAVAHDALANQNWGGADLRAIIDGQLQHQILTYGDRITISGGPHVLPPEATQYVAMAIHELGSNAAKYGALAGEAGNVSISWTVTNPADNPELILSWVETVPLELTSTRREGFGHKILTVLTPKAINGSAEMDFTQGGLKWTLTAPATAPDPQGPPP